MGSLPEWQKRWEEVSRKPSPIKENGKKYCPKCYEQGRYEELRSSRQFLCRDHYKKFRSEKERIRLRIKRDGYEIIKKDDEEVVVAVKKEKGYNTKLGTSDFGPHIQTGENDTPDFDREGEVVRNELDRITNEETIGDYSHRNAYGGYKPEAREAQEKNLAYAPGFDGYVQFDIDEQDTETNAPALKQQIRHESDEESIGEEYEDEDEYYQMLIDKYEDWSY